MFQRFFVLAALVLFLSPLSMAQENGGVEVAEIEFGAGVENRQPVGVDTNFPATVERVYCFTKIIGAADSTFVSHVWYYEGEEKARVELAVKSQAWRTWSSKKILESWEGRWRVEVVSAEGNVIAGKEFVVGTVAE